MATNNSVRYLRSPHLVCYWENRRLVIENFATRTRLEDVDASRLPADALLLCRIVNFFDRWRPAETLFKHMPEYPRGLVETMLLLAADGGFLRRSDRAPDARERAMDQWTTWNPAAGFMHASTKDVAYAGRSTTGLEAPPPNQPPEPRPVKRYRGVPTLRLPRAETHGEFPQILLARRSWRQFKPQSVSQQDLATLLGLTWGIQHRVRGPGRWPMILKTSPSGGARHPIEVYVLARRVEGIAAGLYHYAPDLHRLELVRRGATSRQIAGYLPSQAWYGRAAALMLMTVVFPRKIWRYKYARAYRSLLVEAGHFGQTFCLLATSLGLAPFCTNALADSRIESDLGIDGVTESVMYAVGVGRRLPGMAWAPWPYAPAYARVPASLAAPSEPPANNAT